MESTVKVDEFNVRRQGLFVGDYDLFQSLGLLRRDFTLDQQFEQFESAVM